MTNRPEITALLKDYYQTIDILRFVDGGFSAEFGGEIPATLVEKLKDLGADVYVYHKTAADASTVVTF